jgi:glycosyltransferase involved in cell wall biosynthesis
MHNDVIVTVGLCVKNAEKTIKDAINSVIHQDFPHEFMEIIIVDGQSEDRTLELIRETLAQSDIQNTLFSENRGLGFARQIVVDNAKGDYIVWVDGDLLLSRDYIKKQVEFMEINTKVGIGSGCHEILPKANLIASLEDVAYIAVNFRFKGECPSILPGTAGCIFRVVAIHQVGGFDLGITGVGEDIELAFRIREAGWSISRVTDAIFFERRRVNLRELWEHYVWYGYGGYDVFCKNQKVITFPFMNPIVAFLIGAWYSILAYKSLNKKFVFYLPFYYSFKRLAWCFGFVKSQMGTKKCW